MTHDRADRRVQRTRRLLQAALIELSADRGFDAVTVGDIAERANVNRATFYRHYQDKYGLVDEMFQQAAGRLRRSLKPHDRRSPDIDLQNPPERLVELFEHCAEYREFYRMLLGMKGSSWFVARMREQISSLFDEREQLRERFPTFKLKKPEVCMPRPLAGTLVSALLVTTITWWLENGKEYTPSQMAGWFLDFLLNGYVRVVGL